MTDDAPVPFLVSLRDTVRPEVLDRAATDLARVVAAVQDHRKKGRITLTIELTPYERVPNSVEVTATVKATPPEPAPVATPMFTSGDADGRLYRNNPRQTTIDDHLRAVDQPANEGTGS